jgi:phenylpyruvate tautomerase PptA (4-oxalocrotonate tautomerase family)
MAPMPLLSLVTSAPSPSPEARARLFSGLSSLLARELDKPEAYVMVTLAAGAAMSFGGDASTAACYAELKNVGSLSPGRVAELSRILCAAIGGALDLPQDRIYIEFTNADGAMWGWNGETFA